MPQPVHLQYNSPMQLYSKETAEEQFAQQVGNAGPIALPAADKHFDPTKSATLRYIRDQDHGRFGESTMDKIAAVEAPRQFEAQEPGWARYAREKSERARSRTPAADHHSTSGGYYAPGQAPAPLCHPVHQETAREFADKQRVYTNATHPIQTGPAYYQVADHTRRPRTHSESAKFDRGYECGGMDFTKGLTFENSDGDYYYEHRPRREERARSRPGYECGGTDFGKGYVASGPYHGHGPDPPRLRSHYSADPRSPCNAYVAPNIDAVDANLLVGDTLSNQKIRHEVRNINQSEFGTSFAPAPGFKHDHMLVRQNPGPPEPVTFCVSAPKQSAAYSSAPHEQQNVWRNRQEETDRQVNVQTLLTDEAIRPKARTEEIPNWREKSLEKQQNWENRPDPRLHRLEVYTTEPNWSRNVQQRRNAWEQKASETDARVGMPASAKVAPDAPPAWHNKAVRTHNVWQNAADNMHQYQQQNYQSSYSSQQTRQERSPQPLPQQQGQQYHSETRSETRSESHNAPLHAHYDGSTNAQQLLNSGYNQNQVDYILSHQDKYGPGKKYAFPSNQSANYQTSSDFHSSSNNFRTSSSNAFPVTTGQHLSQQNNQFSSHLNQQNNQFSSQQNQQNSQFSNQQNQLQSSTDQRGGNYSTTTHEEGQLPNGGVYSKTMTESRSSSHNVNPASYATETHISHSPFNANIPQAGTFSSFPASNNYQENYRKSMSSSTKTETTAPVMVAPVQSSQKDSYFKSSKSSSSTTETRTVPVAPVTSSSFQKSYNMSSSSQNMSQPQHIMAPQALSPAASYKSYSSSHYSKQEKTSNNTNSGPVGYPAPQVTTTLPVTKTTSYSYSSTAQPSQPAPTQMSQNSFTSNFEKNTSSVPMSSHLSENYMKSHREESHREETSRPVSQLSQYSESRNYKRNYEEKTETTMIPSVLPPVTTNYSSSSSHNMNSATNINDVFDKKKEMNETLPRGSLSNTHNNTAGGYRDKDGHDVSYKRELSTAANPGKEYALLKEEEKRVVETPLEPGVISRHVTTKYYKKKTVTDTSTSTVPEAN